MAPCLELPVELEDEQGKKRDGEAPADDARGRRRPREQPQQLFERVRHEDVEHGGDERQMDDVGVVDDRQRRRDAEDDHRPERRATLVAVEPRDGQRDRDDRRQIGDERESPQLGAD